jgi:PIN domain nuclease of toxin-antitoxin system
VSSVVLDASAVLAVIHGERGSERVVDRLSGALILAVNYSEVLKKLVEGGVALVAASYHVGNFKLTVVPFDEPLAALAADLFPRTREWGLSFADRACLALAMQRNAEVITAEQRWSKLDLGAQVTLIREPR